jgi:PKD repeat protein
MPYYIAEIRLNVTSKSVKGERKMKKRLITRLVTILLACLLILTPILVIPATVGSDQTVVIEALGDLHEDVLNLPVGDDGFNNPRAAAGQRKALVSKINATINQIKSGAYGGAINKLTNDLKGTISEWVADEYASLLIEKVENIIDLIEDIFKPPVHDMAISNVAPSVDQAYIGDIVVIDVTVVNEGTKSEVFDVYVYADIDIAVVGDEITIDIISNVSLEAEATTTLSVTWDTASVVEGTYTISAEVPPVKGEEDTDNNLYIDGTVTVSPMLTHDVAVTSVSAPDEVTHGNIVTISVNVANLGDSDETLEVTVTYDTTPIGTQSVTLASKDFTMVLFAWDTTDVDPDTYTITAEAILAEDGDLTNNGGSTTITVKLEIVLIPPVAKITDNATTVLTDEVIRFNASTSYDPDGYIVKYFWDFGDGTNSSDVIVDHQYTDDETYTVTLTVTDNDDLTSSDTAAKIIENRPPVALFTQSVEDVKTSKSTRFDASSSYDPDGTIESYFWNFGDETNATGVEVMHSYEDDGSYTVTLTVTDDDGTTNSKNITKTVLNRPPIASFTENETEVDVGKVIHFSASESYDPDGHIVKYFWDFGDGTNETGMIIDHTYNKTGNYTVTLTVTDDDGATDSDISKIAVNALPEIPWALFAVLGLSIIAAAATFIYLWYRRRKRRKTVKAKTSPRKPAVTLYLPAKILAEHEKSS